MHTRDRRCEQARFWASLALDGELSELERAALDEHLDSCAGCREAVAGIGMLASALRAAPLEQPPPLVLPARQRGRLGRPSALAALAAAAVVVLAAGAGSLVGTLASSGSGVPSGRAGAAAQKPFIEQQLIALANASVLPPRARGSGRVIAS